ARALSSRLPPTFGGARLLQATDAVLPDNNGTPPKRLAALRSLHRVYAERVTNEIAWLGTTPLRPEVKSYLALALDCSYADRARLPADPPYVPPSAAALPPGTPPLVVYRASICE